MVPLNTPIAQNPTQILIQAEQVAWFWNHIESMREIAADIAAQDLDDLDSVAHRVANDLTAEMIDDGDGLEALGFSTVLFNPETGRQIEIDDESDWLDFVGM